MDSKVTSKIIDNSFGEREFNSANFNFKFDPAFNNDVDTEDEVHTKLLFDDIDKIVKASEYNKFNNPDEKGNRIKLNKMQINKVYAYVIKELKSDYKKIEIWAALSEYFDIYPNKFYSSLSNIFKHQLMIELDESTGILNKKNIKKLF